MLVNEKHSRSWQELDPTTREALDTQYLKELAMISEPGLTEEGVRAYLDYRHERPDAAITTFEEGQMRRMLHRWVDPTRLPDPVEQQDHRGWLEQFFARRFHWTNERAYVAVMVSLTFAFVLVLMFWLL
jgi:hypothetical protein